MHTPSARHCQEWRQAPAGGETAARDKSDGVRKRTRKENIGAQWTRHADRNIFSSPCFHSLQTNHLTKACASARTWLAFKTRSQRSWRCWCRTISFFHGDIILKCSFNFIKNPNDRGSSASLQIAEINCEDGCGCASTAHHPLCLTSFMF